VGASGLVSYTYNGTEDLPLLDVYGTLAYDSFKFNVRDAQGANSTEAFFKVAVRLPLVAEASSVDFGSDENAAKLYTVYEATEGNVSVYATDQSDQRRPVSVRIQSVPRHGTLYDPISGLQLLNGSVVNTTSTYPYLAPVLVTYIGNKNYLNSPKIRYNGTGLEFQDGDDDDNFEGEGGAYIQ
jgi:hypothetical protein